MLTEKRQKDTQRQIVTSLAEAIVYWSYIIPSDLNPN